MNTQHATLHEPLLPVLRHVLATAGLPRGGLLLDLACGTGDKLPLLAEACPEAHLLALDIDRIALRKTQQPQLKTSLGVVADALALPLRANCLDAACCIAALGLFGDRHAALAELRHALRPGSAALLVTSDQRWVELTPWPEELAGPLLEALCDSMEAWGLPAAEDVGGELVQTLADAGFTDLRVRAFLLDGGTPLRAELPLLPWSSLHPHLASRLDPARLALCEATARTAEIELRPLVLVARACAPG